MKHRTVTCGTCGATRDVIDGSELRAWRTKAGLSLREMGKRMNLSASFLCDAELNRRNPTEQVVRAYRVAAKEMR